MKIEPSGVLLTGICEVQTEKCVAKIPAPITAVWGTPGRAQVNVCRPCLDEMVRSGEWQIESARLKRRADVAVFDNKGNLQLVVEAKYTKRNEDSLKRAVQIRRNLLAHSGIPGAPFFLIVFPAHLYLWKRTIPDAYDRQADYSVDAGNILESYAVKWEKSVESISPIEFERLVSEWIEDLIHNKDGAEIPEWAALSGLYDAIKNGAVVTEVAI